MKLRTVLFIAVVVGLLMVVLSFRDRIAQAASSYLTYNQSGEATTTVAYMTPGTGTTTLSFNTSEIEKSGLYIQYTASTSPAVLQWQYQLSNNNIDWFEEDIYGSSISVTQNTIDHASTTVTHRWNSGSTVASTSRKVLSMPSTPAKYTRVQFSIPIGSVNGAVWAQVANRVGLSY